MLYYKVLIYSQGSLSPCFFYLFINIRKAFKVNMASQVLSGSGNVSYTNNTGQIVRIIINSVVSTTVSEITIGWGNPSSSAQAVAGFVLGMGKNISHNGSSSVISAIPGLSPINYITSTVGDGMVIDPISRWANGPNSAIISNTSGTNPPPTRESSLPTEVYLNPGDTFSVVGKGYVLDSSGLNAVWPPQVDQSGSSTIRGYNIVVIPENG
jgi:hypothetical protein